MLLLCRSCLVLWSTRHLQCEGNIWAFFSSRVGNVGKADGHGEHGNEKLKFNIPH